MTLIPNKHLGKKFASDLTNARFCSKGGIGGRIHFKVIRRVRGKPCGPSKNNGRGIEAGSALRAHFVAPVGHDILFERYSYPRSPSRFYKVYLASGFLFPFVADRL